MSMLPARLRRIIRRNWKTLGAFSALFLVTGSALTWKLSSLLPGYSANEQIAAASSTSLHHIWNNPLDAPFHVLVMLCSYITPNDLFATRLASVLIAWVSLVVFCILLFRWYGTRTALIGTLLFGTSSWFLHTGRLGTPAVMFLGILGLIACGLWLRERRGAGLAVLLGLILAAILIYTPGMVWFLAIGLLWQWRHIDSAFKHNLGAVSLGALLFLTGIAPLAWQLYKQPDLITTWLRLPDTWQPLHFLHNLIDIPLAIFYRGQANPELWLGRMPLLSVFSIVAFVLGIYLFWKHFKLARVKLFVTIGLVGSVAVAFMDGGVPVTLLAPFVYVVVAVGASYLIERWLEVFPRNPIARSFGMALFGALVALTCLYNLRSYFIAWPQATITRNVFTVKPEDL
jgi:hypothetical protein